MIQRATFLRQVSAIVHNPASRPRVSNSARYLQTTRNVSTDSNSPSSRLRNFIYGSSLIFGVSLGYFYLTDTRASLHRYIVPPLIRALYPDAEAAHHAGTAILKELHTLGLNPRERGTGDADGKLAVEVFGYPLSNPIGISGGLDKNAEIPDALLALGPGIVEIGGVTPHPQGGNPTPRVFRVASQKALINRYGLNSEGADYVGMLLRQRLRQYAYANGFGLGEEAERFILDGKAGVPPGSLAAGRLLAVQIAKNKATTDDDLDAVVNDHVYCVEHLGKYADILVVNVSSPNTPGLRSLQSQGPLTRILSAVVEAAQSTPRHSKPVVMVKVSPDEDSQEQVQGICDAVWAAGVDGVIVGNTTTKRPEAIPKEFVLPPKDTLVLREQGGYSGPQLFEQTVSLIKKYRKLLDDGPKFDPLDASAKEKALASKQKTIFASGGITNGVQALEALNAGASVAMVYTAVVYGGVGTVSRIKEEMKKRLREG